MSVPPENLPPSDPQYPEYQGYPNQLGFPPPQQGPAQITVSLGARAWRRPDARFGQGLAGAGAALAVVGAAVWSIGYFASGFGVDFDFDNGGPPDTHGQARRFLGFVLFLGISLAGYAVTVIRRRGPLATAGTVASAAGVPLAVGFVFLDIGGAFRSGDSPINVDAVFLLSIVVWLVSYFLIPGCRGRAVYLALAAIALPSYIAIKVAGDSAFQAGASFASDGTFYGGGDSHTGTVAALSLVFGLAYYAIAALLDRTGRSGVAIGMLYPAFGTTVAGLLAAADSFKQVGTGVALIIIGTVVALYGGRYGRRFTTWVWSAGAAAGVVLVIAKIDIDKYWLIGILLIVIGVGVAGAAQLASRALDEEPDVVEAPPTVW